MVRKSGRVFFSAKNRDIHYEVMQELWFWYGGAKIWFN